MEQQGGMDPEVKRYFRKIINSFSYGLLWLMAMVTAGLFFKLGIIEDGVQWYHFLFYGLVLVTFVLLIRYLYRLWSK